MARSAGAYTDGNDSAQFTTPNGVSYRIHNRTLEFEHGDVQGSRQLAWFIGSGHTGRSFLFSQAGFFFQAPVSFYTKQNLWDASPGYESRNTVDLTRPVEPACLQCHASSLAPRPGTQNGFASPPFGEGGVSCQRCHGEGADHIRTGRKSAIVNPVRLAAPERDSICAQCHLTGAARIARAPATPYTPGGRLSRTLAVFVWEGGGSVNATSHYDRLELSACKRASGNQLWCATCHSVHGEPVEPQTRCQSCHEKKPCTEAPAARQAKNGDCIACHMPKREQRLGDHLAFTDHRIARRPAADADFKGERALRPYWPGEVNERDTALAYAVAAMTEPALRRPALAQLEAAVQTTPRDAVVLVQLAQFYDRMRREDDALALYERALGVDSAQAAATVNLGTHRARQGRLSEAIALWRKALQRNPAQTGVRLNLAVALARTGRRAEALAELDQALAFDPDSGPARQLRNELQATP